MANERDLTHDIADEGLEKIIEGDEEKGRRMIEEAKKRDPKAVEELAEEVERDREQAEHFIDRK